MLIFLKNIAVNSSLLSLNAEPRRSYKNKCVILMYKARTTLQAKRLHGEVPAGSKPTCSLTMSRRVGLNQDLQRLREN